MIDIDSVSKIFGSGDAAFTALNDVTLTIAENEFFTLLGPSGCGKTTLLRLIAGFEHPSSGSMHLSGQDISHLAPNKRPVNTVFQSYALFPHMTVAGNIAFGLEMLGRPKRDIRETVDKMLALVQMEDLRNRKTSEISGGQQQRVALARALAPQPKVLLLDEPLSALDLKLRKEMQIELKRLQNETGITFVFVTHDQEEALTMSDRIAVMSAGHVHQIGAPRDIYDHPATRFVASFIGDSNFLPAHLSQTDGATAQVTLKDGPTLPVSAPQGRTGDVTVLIRPEHITLATASGQPDGLFGTIENIVYFGTDTHFHVRLDTGEPMMVRTQNSPDNDHPRNIGENVAIQIRPGAVQVLND
ncbi:MAG: ABC transporter ATP-binding protein [Sedimentitalea sp.]